MRLSLPLALTLDEEEDEDDDYSSRRRRMMLLLAYHRIQQKTTMWRYECLNAEGRLRRNRSLPRPSLVDPSESPWARLYSSRNDQSLITVTGLDHDAFDHLLSMYKPYFDNFSPWTRTHEGTTFRRMKTSPDKRPGKKRIIMAHASLALVLTWYRFRGAEFILQGWFGFTGTHANVWLRFARRMLLKALLAHEAAAVTLPSSDRIEELKKQVRKRHPNLRDVFSVADGLKLCFQACAGLVEQGMYYNGWTHGHYVTNLFVFSICGRIIACVLNVPGSIHDSTVAVWGGVYDKLEAVFNENGGKCCVDSAFASGPNAFLIRSSEDITKARNELELVQQLEATSLRQAAEWGMRAIQSAFPRMKETIKYDEDPTERRLILKLLVLLYNYRLEKVGLNQIRNTYVPAWSRDSEFEMGGFV